jgi:general secretion pathway protein M
MNTPAKAPVLGSFQSALRQAWAQRQPREQKLLALGAAVLVLAALWQLGLAPALRTWQEAPTQQARLDQQTQAMRQLQAQAKKLQQPLTVSRNESVQWLEQNLAELGAGAKISMQGERATLSLEAAPAEALARWLSQARERALALPVQAQLQQRSASEATGKAKADRPNSAPGAKASANGPAGVPSGVPSVSPASAGAYPATSSTTPTLDTDPPGKLWRGSLVLRLP